LCGLSFEQDQRQGKEKRGVNLARGLLKSGMENPLFYKPKKEKKKAENSKGNRIETKDCSHSATGRDKEVIEVDDPANSNKGILNFEMRRKKKKSRRKSLGRERVGTMGGKKSRREERSDIVKHLQFKGAKTKKYIAYTERCEEKRYSLKKGRGDYIPDLQYLKESEEAYRNDGDLLLEIGGGKTVRA